MAITVQCGDCFETMRLRDDLLGKTIRCKSCGSVIRVTANAEGGTATKKRKSTVPTDDSDPDESEPDTPVARRKRSKTTKQRSFGDVARWLYDTPWTFLLFAISAGLIAAAFLPAKFAAGQHLLVLREVPIGAAYLFVGMAWYLATGAYSDRRKMTITENYLENVKLRLQLLPILALMFGAVQLENVFARVLCGAVVIGIVVWKSSQLKPHEWRPTCLVLIGLAYVVPPVVMIFRDIQR